MGRVDGLSLPAGIDGDAILDAISIVETQKGANNWPRLEAGYMPNGVIRTVQGRLVMGTGACVNALVMSRWHQFDMWSAASFGPWQILYHTAADLGYAGDPRDLWKAQVSRPWVIDRLNEIVKHGSATVEEIGDAWNSGRSDDPVGPAEADYRTKIRKAYDAAMTARGGT